MVVSFHCCQKKSRKNALKEPMMTSNGWNICGSYKNAIVFVNLVCWWVGAGAQSMLSHYAIKARTLSLKKESFFTSPSIFNFWIFWLRFGEGKLAYPLHGLNLCLRFEEWRRQTCFTLGCPQFPFIQDLPLASL